MHETYWLWQASPLPWANAPDAEMTIADVSHSKAGFMDALSLERSQPATCTREPCVASIDHEDGYQPWRCCGSQERQTTCRSNKRSPGRPTRADAATALSRFIMN